MNKKTDKQAAFRLWVAANLHRTTKPAKGLAAELGLHPSRVTSMLKSGGRAILAHEVSKIVEYIGSEPPPGVLGGTPEEADFSFSGTRAVTPTRKIPIVAIIAPGMWRDRETEPIRLGFVSLLEDSDPRLEGMDQYACWIDQPRSYAICVKYDEIRKKPLHGDIVHVRRTNKAGQVEDTIRKITASRGKVQLVLHNSPSRSAQKAIAFPSENPDDKVEIAGLVVGFYNKTF